MVTRIFALIAFGVSSWALGAGSYVARIPPLLTNDTYFTSQWNLHNKGPGPTSLGRGTVQGSDHAHVAEAWELLRELGVVHKASDIGKSLRLAVIDDGFDLQHEDLKDKFVATKNFGGAVTPGNLFSVSPQNFHGTLLTGLAAASADNGKGIAGACPGCRLIAARMAAKKPSGQTIEDYYQNIFDWVMAQNPDVINCSWGPDAALTPGFAQQLIEKLTREGRGGKGIVVVFASGNGGDDISGNYFANNPAVITVGASNSSGKRYTFSNYGPGLDLMAPTSGGQVSSDRYVDPIWTTDNYLAPDCLKNSDRAGAACSDKAGWTPYSNMAGGDSWEGRYSSRFSHTSSAAPIVSGVAALVLQANPNLSSNEVQNILQHTADRVSPVDASYDATGFSPLYGYGRVNALRAVAVAYEMTGKNLSSQMKARIDLTSACTRTDCWAWPIR